MRFIDKSLKFSFLEMNVKFYILKYRTLYLHTSNKWIHTNFQIRSVRANFFDIFFSYLCLSKVCHISPRATLDHIETMPMTR